jgi:hypothetical protein
MTALGKFIGRLRVESARSPENARTAIRWCHRDTAPRLMESGVVELSSGGIARNAERSRPRRDHGDGATPAPIDVQLSEDHPRAA